MKLLEKYADYAYAFLRIVTGFMFMFHGAQRGSWGYCPSSSHRLLSQLWIGGLIELVGGLAVMLGFQTRLTAFLCSGTMAVAYFQFLWKFQGGANIFPVINKGELAVLYCFVFLLIACRGGVKWCLDKKS